ncbi:MAG: hypothetical protein ABH820_03170 [Patescibacteria group bacterium]
MFCNKSAYRCPFTLKGGLMEALHPKIEAKWISAIQTVSLEKQDSEYAVSVKALGPFSPNLLEAASVHLILVTTPGKFAVISGELKAVETDSARGLWYRYIFIPRKKGALVSLRFSGRNQFSNVKRFWFQLFTEMRYHFKNPWYRDQAGQKSS